MNLLKKLEKKAPKQKVEFNKKICELYDKNNAIINKKK